MNPEWFDAAWKIAALVFAAGSVWSELRAVRKDIARLEAKRNNPPQECAAQTAGGA